MYILDQWFSVKNLKKIYDFEKRKWIQIEDKFKNHYYLIFLLNNNITEEAKKRNEFYKLRKKYIIDSTDYQKISEKIQNINNEIDKLKELRENKILKILEKVSENINTSIFEFWLKKELETKTKKYIYKTEKHESFYCIKKLQYNINKIYKVIQSNRFQIVSWLILSINNKLPKKIIKLDLKSFYESISFDQIINQIEKDWFLSFQSINFLKIINEEYKSLGNVNWLPRWLWISAYLSEFYMRNFDENIKNMNGIYYYWRYVDDIIIVAENSTKDYVNEINKVIKNNNLTIQINSSKNKFIMFDIDNSLKVSSLDFDWKKIPNLNSFDYLWYNIKFEKNWDSNIKVNLSNKKNEKIKQKIDLAFHFYNFNTNKWEKTSQDLIIKRIRYLTSNVNLIWKKKNIKTWIYYSNSLIDENNVSINELDNYLKSKIGMLTNNRLKEKLNTFSFEEWFKNKNLYFLKRKNINNFKKLTKIWKYV